MSHLRVQAVVDGFTSSSLNKFLQTLLLTDCPAEYQLQVHLLAYTNPQLDISLTDWQGHFAARTGELRYDFVADCPTPLAAHNRAVALWPGADRLLIVEPDGLLPFHLVERLLALADARPGWGAVAARQIPLAPPLSPELESLEITALAGGAYLLESATFTQFGFDENLPGLEIALLDLGWRLRAQARCLYLAADTFVYRPRQVTNEGLVYRPGEELALLAGWGLLLNKYGQTEAAQVWRDQLEAGSGVAREALALWEAGRSALHPASSEEIACADFSYRPDPAAWLPSSNPDRNYGNLLDSNFEEIVISKPVTPSPTTSLAAKLEEVLSSLDLANAPLLDLSGTLQGYLAGSNLGAQSVKASELATLVGKLDNSAAPLMALALPQANERSLLKKLADLTGQGHLRGLLLVAPNPTHQDIAAHLLAGDVPEPERFTGAYGLTALQQLVAATGWQVAGRYDLLNERSRFYAPDRLLHEGSLAGEAVRWLARQFNSAATVEYFVWWLEPLGQPNDQPEKPALPQPGRIWPMPPLRVVEDPLDPAAEKPAPTDEPPQVSVLIRTMGRRNELLLENLYSIYAQDCPPQAYEVMVALQIPPQAGREAADSFYQLLPKLPPELVARMRVIELYIEGMTFSDNPLLEISRGRYWFYLDDDDLLLGGYFPVLLRTIEEQGSQNPLIQALGVRRDVEVCKPPASTLLDPTGYSATYPYVVRRLELFWERPWQDVYQFFNNEFPPYSYAVPRALIEQTRLRYNTDYILYEDWEFLMRAAKLLKVVSLPVFAGCTNLRDNNTQTVGNSELAEGWRADYQRLATERANDPLLLPGRAIGEIIASFQQLEELRQRLYAVGQQLEEARQVIALRDATAADLSRSLLEVGSELEYVRNHLEGQLAQTREQLITVGGELDYVRSHLTAELERTRDQIELRDAELQLVRQINLAHQIEINRLNEGRYLQYHQLEAVQSSADHYRQRLEELEPYARSLEQELAAMRTSPSWRLTLPLRMLRRLLGR